MKYFYLFIFICSFIFGQTDHWRVIWDANPDSDAVNFYELNKFTTLDNNVFNVIDTLYVDNDILPGVLYSYYLRAYNAAGYSDNSDTVSASIPEALQFPSQVIKYNESFNNYVLSNYVNEPDGDIVIWSFESTNDSLIVDDLGTVIVVDGFFGTVNITATVSDLSDFESLTSFSLTRIRQSVPSKVTGLEIK